MWNTLLVNFKTIYFYLYLALLIKGKEKKICQKVSICTIKALLYKTHYFETCGEVGYVVQYVLCTGEIVIFF